MKRSSYKSLPKIDLHHHLDGSVRVGTIRDLALAMGKELPTKNVRKLAPYCQVGPDCRSLTDFLQKFFFFYDFLKSAEAVERIGYEICEDAVKDNIIYFETRFAPILQSTKDFSMKEVVECAIRGIERGRKKFKVEVGVILCCYRSESPESSMETVKLAHQYRDRGVVGIDFAGDESRFPAAPHYPAFDLAKKYGIPVTIHAGEAGEAGNVREAVERLGAKRIGHGVRSIEDESVMELLRKRNITLEVCPTSNVQTCISPNLETHPVKRLADAGIHITINTDDPGVSNITLTHEYTVAVQKCGLTRAQLAVAVRRAVDAAFCSDPTRKKIRKIIDKAWAKIR